LTNPHDNSRGDDDRDRVREASDIVAVVGEHLTLRAKGREFVGICPFHDDHKPSMYVVPAKQIFHCFSCGAGGDVFTFVQRYHSMEFPEALKFLADRAGVELTPRHNARARADGDAGVGRAQLAEALAFADAFYRKILTHPEHGSAARAVAERRGLSGELGERFGIGASPDMWDGLLKTIEAKGLDTEPFVACGLLKRRDNGGLYDALRNRLIFPIRDQLGRTVAFGGRRIDDDDEPKYLNSPEHPLFNKSATLYGLDLAARALTKAGGSRQLVIVEGYTDVIACHGAGFDSAVATLGTALTAQHARVLRRYQDVTVVLLFDGDEAGRRAADRAVEVFFAEPIDVRVATMPADAKDPDELLAEPDGRARFAAVLDASQDVLAWRFEEFQAELADRGVHARAALVERYLARLNELGLGTLDPVRRRFVLRQLASITGLGWEDITRLAPAGRRARSPSRDHPSGEQPDASRAERDVEPRLTAAGGVVAAVLAEPKLARRLSAGDRDALGSADYASARMRSVAEFVLQRVASQAERDVAEASGWTTTRCSATSRTRCRARLDEAAPEAASGSTTRCGCTSRRWASIPLLTRDEEIRLAKKIETTRMIFRRRCLECDYIAARRSKILEQVDAGDLPFDRTMRISTAEENHKEKIAQRIPSNLGTIERLLERNARTGRSSSAAGRQGDKAAAHAERIADATPQARGAARGAVPADGPDRAADEQAAVDQPEDDRPARQQLEQAEIKTPGRSTPRTSR
jgi:DNA primase